MTTSEEQIDNEFINMEKGDIVKGFKIEEYIAEGGFGRVFRVSKPDYSGLAMKVESNNINGGSAIKLEARVLVDADGDRSFPQFVNAGKTTKFNWIVMELLGVSLKTAKNNSPNRMWTTKTWSRILIQCLYAVKTLHAIGYVHRDVKLDNFALTLDHVYFGVHIKLVDFGCARKFLCDPGPIEFVPEHLTIRNYPYRREPFKFIPLLRLPRQRVDFRGTDSYASLNSHYSKELGRHDDIWSLMYMTIDIINELPWKSIGRLSAIKSMKENFGFIQLMTEYGTNKPYKYSGMIAEIEKMLKNTTYYRRPNYQLVYEWLKSEMKDSGANWTDKYDWQLTYEPDHIGIRPLRTAPWEYDDNFFQKDDWPTMEIEKVG